MPIMRCKLPNGKSGYKYGNSGKCYASKSAAEKQGRAIAISKAREAGHKIPKGKKK